MPAQGSLRAAAFALVVAAAAAQMSGSFFDTPCAEGLRNITFSNNDLCDDVYDVYKAICHPIVATNEAQYEEMRQCCSMIEDTYKDRCDDEEDSDISDRMIMGTVIILVACFAVRGAVRHLQLLWLPESAATIMVGMIAGLLIKASDAGKIHFSEDLFMRVFLPPILLEATLAIDKRSFRKLIGPILLFAIVGSIISTFGVGYLVHYGSKAMPGVTLPAIESLLYGALISSVDPVAVLAVFNYFGIPQTNTLYVISFGESVLNDAAVVTLFTTIRSFRYGTDLSEDNINDAVGLFFEILAGSVAIGLAGGVLSVAFFKLLPKVNGARMEAILFFLFAFMPYYVADALGWSGIVAIVVTGLIMDFRTKDLLCVGARKHIMFSVELLSMLFETAIFAYLGMFIVTEKYHWDASLIFLAIITAVGVRAFHVVVLSGLCNMLYRPPSLDDKPAINLSDGDDATLDPAVRIHGSTSQRFSEQSASRDAGNFMNIDNSPEAEEDSCSKQWLCGAPRDKGKQEKDMLLPWKYQFFLFYGGLRGALSFALAENVGEYDVIFDKGSHYHGEVLAMTSATILFHMLIMGGTVGFLLQWAGFGSSAKRRFKNAPEHMLRALNDGDDADLFDSEPSSQISRYIPRYSVSS